MELDADAEGPKRSVKTTWECFILDILVMVSCLVLEDKTYYLQCVQKEVSKKKAKKEGFNLGL